MLRLPQFQVATPTTLAEALDLLQQGSAGGARLIAGGTDLLPNLKHHLERPGLLVSLGRVRELRRLERDDDAGHLWIGAGLKLAEIAQHPQVRAHFPSLAKSAGLVAAPTIRDMATLGGNINLDTRCRYVNQTELWRRGIGGGCLKSEGDVCHVVPTGRRCVAAMSSDNVPVLISLGAVIHLQGPAGPRALPLADYFHADGLRHTHAAPGEITTAVTIPLPTGPRRSDYIKWSVRQSIDFPLVSVALRFDLDADRSDAPITAVRVVAGVLGAKPRELNKLDEAILGRSFGDPDVARLISEAAYAQCKPLPNVPYDPAYRREMIRVLTRRAIAALI